MSDYEERQEREYWGRVVAVEVTCRAREMEGPEPPAACYRCGATEGMAHRDLCRPCGLAIRAVLRRLPDDERGRRSMVRMSAPVAALDAASEYVPLVPWGGCPPAVREEWNRYIGRER